MRLGNNILGNSQNKGQDSNIDLGKILSDEEKENSNGLCNNRYFLGIVVLK